MTLGGAAEDAATFHAAASVYDRHVGRYGAALARELVRFAELPGEGRALDVGCGPGALTGALDDELGAERVAAVDPSQPFAAACEERFPGVEVRVAAAEALPFGDGEFGAVLSQLVVNFLADREGGVAEMCRVTRPGGVVAACVWDYREGMTMLRVFWDAAIALDPAAAEQDEGRRMIPGSAEELTELWSGRGLEEVTAGELVVAASYADFDDFWAPFPTGIAPSGAYCASLAPGRQVALRDEVWRRLGSPAGEFTLNARAWAVRGLVPRVGG